MRHNGEVIDVAMGNVEVQNLEGKGRHEGAGVAKQ